MNLILFKIKIYALRIYKFCYWNCLKFLIYLNIYNDDYWIKLHTFSIWSCNDSSLIFIEYLRNEYHFSLLAWTFWALSWASINYFLWKKLGWPIIKSLVWKYWKYVFLSVSHYEQTEIFFKKHWWITTFNWRFIPAVRQLISIPAWVFKMDFKKFVLYTFIWAWIWNIILLSIWYIAWQNKELISNYSHIALIWVLVLIALVSVLYYFIDKHFLGKNK